MPLIKFGNVWDNILVVAIVFAVFFFIYHSMKEGRLKEKIRDLFEKLKPEKVEK